MTREERDKIVLALLRVRPEEKVVEKRKRTVQPPGAKTPLEPKVEKKAKKKATPAKKGS